MLLSLLNCLLLDESDCIVFFSPSILILLFTVTVNWAGSSLTVKVPGRFTVDSSEKTAYTII